MDNSSAEVCRLLGVVDSLLAAIVDSGLELSPLVCANTLYGLQNCSIADESTRRIMYLVVTRAKEMLVSQSTAVIARQGPLGKFSDLLSLYQALSLVVPMLPDLGIDTDLQVELLTVEASFAQIVSDRSAEFKPVPLSPTEARLFEGISELLAKEPFEVTHSEILHGFTACVVVRLKEGVQLQTSTGELWSPLLVIEPIGGANESFPRRQLFTRLKHDFFSRRVSVQTVPVASLIGKGRSLLREKLLELPNLLHSLYPPTKEDSAKFSNILFSMGLSQAEGLLSSIHSPVEQVHSGGGETGGSGSSSSFFTGGANNVFLSGGSEESCDGSLECCLDFQETAASTAAQRSIMNNPTTQGMAIRWIGDPPLVVSTSLSSHPRNSPLNRGPTVLPSPTGISVMPATNTNSSNKYIPTLTSTTGVPLASGQYPPPPLLRSPPPRSLHGHGQGQGHRSKIATPTAVYSDLNSPSQLSPSRSTSMDMSFSLDKRALTERLQIVAANSNEEVGNRLTQQNHVFSYNNSKVHTPKIVYDNEGSSGPDDTWDKRGFGSRGSEESQGEGVDNEIEELEAQLEIARLEAKLLKLKNAKAKAAAKVANPLASLSCGSNDSTNSLIASVLVKDEEEIERQLDPSIADTGVAVQGLDLNN
jgi:hypothetical protein